MKNVYFQVKRGKPKRDCALGFSSKRRKCATKMPHSKSEIHIINSKGEKEIFSFQKVYRSVSFQKVYRSALRAGADKDLANEIAEIIKKDLYSGIRKIYIQE